MAEEKSGKKGPKAEKKEKKGDLGALLIPAGIMFGFGVGFLTDNLPAWMFIGLGCGFLGWVVVSLITKGK